MKPSRQRRELGPVINERCLRHREIQVVNSEGKHIGTMTSRDALVIAQDESLDLVMINPALTPPLCKIVNYGKMRYMEAKLEKENRKRQQELKSLRMRPNIAQHDIDTLLNHARKFLLNGDKVKVVCQFKARELAHPEIGKQKLVRFAETLGEIATLERDPVLDGKVMAIMLLPKSGPK